MTEFLADLLTEHSASSASPDELVFRARNGGRVHASNWHRYVWAPARSAAGFATLCFHDLRHSVR